MKMSSTYLSHTTGFILKAISCIHLLSLVTMVNPWPSFLLLGACHLYTEYKYRIIYWNVSTFSRRVSDSNWFQTTVKATSIGTLVNKLTTSKLTIQFLRMGTPWINSTKYSKFLTYDGNFPVNGMCPVGMCNTCVCLQLILGFNGNTNFVNLGHHSYVQLLGVMLSHMSLLNQCEVVLVLILDL